MKQKHVNHVKYRRYSKRKKFVDMLVMFVALGLLIIQLALPEQQQVLSYDVDIPDEAIRLRILAHSDDETDQTMKHQVRDAVSRFVTDRMKDVHSIEDARDVITTSLPDIEQVVTATLNDQDYPHAAAVTYGEKIVFPTKVYDTRVYPQGEYEAVLVTIGDGAGKNWWCVLFPALCFVDFNGDVTLDRSHPQEKEVDEIESGLETSETKDTTEETETQLATKDQGDIKPEAKFWLVEQITALIHKFGG